MIRPSREPSHTAKRSNRGLRFGGMDRRFGKAENPPSGAAGAHVGRSRSWRQLRGIADPIRRRSRGKARRGECGLAQSAIASQSLSHGSTRHADHHTGQQAADVPLRTRPLNQAIGDLWCVGERCVASASTLAGTCGSPHCWRPRTRTHAELRPGITSLGAFGELRHRLHRYTKRPPIVLSRAEGSS